ncbi:hypothetical protein ACFQJD_01695 [Haloplanus sp. GCM10025708]
MRAEALHRCLRIGCGRQDINVADGRSTPSERTDDVHLVERIVVVKSGFDVLCDREGPAEKHPLLAFFRSFDVVEDVLL